MTRDRLVLRVLFGIALGLGGGLIAIEMGTLGLGLLIVLTALSALMPPRFAQLAAVLITTGALWLYVFIGAVGRCSAQPASCSGPPPEPFVAIAALVLAAGLAVAELTRRRVRPRSGGGS